MQNRKSYVIFIWFFIIKPDEKYIMHLLSDTHNASENYLQVHIYWAKVLIDHPQKCNNVFVFQYFGMNFRTLNENTIRHQSCASVEIWHSACSLRMCIHTKPLKCTCNSRNDLNRNSNHRNINNNVFSSHVKLY